MIWIAIRMLTGDAQKFYGIVFGIAFSTLLITQQLTIFINLIERGASGTYNVPSADVWVMDTVSRTTDVNYPLPSTALDKVRSVPGVEWAVPHLRAGASVRSGDGDLEGVSIIGVDDATLIGLPRRMAKGTADVLSQPDSVIIDDVGVTRLFADAAIRSARGSSSTISARSFAGLPMRSPALPARSPCTPNIARRCVTCPGRAIGFPSCSWVRHKA